MAVLYRHFYSKNLTVGIFNIESVVTEVYLWRNRFSVKCARSQIFCGLLT